MTSRFLHHLVWALLTVIAFAGGFVWPDSSTQKANAQTNSGAVSTGSNGAEKNEGPDDLGRRSVTIPGPSAPLDIPQTRVRMFEILSGADRIERFRQIAAFLPSITRENWRGALEAFLAQMRTEGRTFMYPGYFSGEFVMVMQRIGVVAGADAAQEHANAKSPYEREMLKDILNGWAGSDPKAALEWTKSLDPATQRSLHGTLLGGVARNNPALGMDLILADDDGARGAAMPVMMGEVIQNNGFGAAEDLVKSLETRSDVTDGERGSAFWSLASWKISTGQALEDRQSTLDWFGTYAGKSYMGSLSTSMIFADSAQSDPNRTANWLSQNASLLTPAQAEAAKTALVQTWLQQGPDDFASWLAAHPDDPQHDSLAAAAATKQIQASNLQDAQRWLGMVSDPALQAQLLQAAAARAQSKAGGGQAP